MALGNWYLAYDYVDHLESRMLCRVWVVEEVLLGATTEVEAIKEGKEKWNDEVVQAKAGWEERKKTWAHPGESPFDDGPINPRVIYKISLE
jgi:hypothetical protein